MYRCINPIRNQEIFDNRTEIVGYDKLWSYTTRDYKYITLQSHKNEKEELYDLQNDQFEQKDISKNTRFSKIKKRALRAIKTLSNFSNK